VRQRAAVRASGASPQILRIVGQPPLAAVCWTCDRLRCSGCGQVFTAPAPEAAQGPKYDETAVSMMALLRYGAGLPLHRLDHLERNLATPVPASTQWDAVNARVGDVRPAFEELCRRAAQGQIVHNDDSYARILGVLPAAVRKEPESARPPGASAAARPARMAG
jgi:transposase